VPERGSPDTTVIIVKHTSGDNRAHSADAVQASGGFE
jgi:hypothetical protein